MESTQTQNQQQQKEKRKPKPLLPQNFFKLSTFSYFDLVSGETLEIQEFSMIGDYYPIQQADPQKVINQAYILEC